MKCDKCKGILDHLPINAKHGSMIACPLCGQETTVKYTFRDSFTDRSVIPFGNLKYASRNISIAWIIAFFVFFALLFLLLKGIITGEVTIIK